MTTDQYTRAHAIKSALSEIGMKKYVLRAEIEKSERIGSDYEKMRVTDMRKWLSELDCIESNLTKQFEGI